MKLLFVEDEKLARVSLAATLRKAGHQVTVCETGDQGLTAIGESAFDVVLTDLRLPGADGLEIVQRAKHKDADCVAIVMTGYPSVPTAVEALKLGAYDYLTKPFSPEKLLNLLERVGQLRRVMDENKQLKSRLDRLRHRRFVGSSMAMRRVKETISAVAEGDFTVLIDGESGTGKEVVASEVHRLSARADKPFVKVNCSALAESVLESELFGHERGAFTGATQRHIGRFERANSGTIFLDDIDDLSTPLQVKLLRVLQERELERVGGQSTLSLDIRVICATKIDLEEAARDHRFRLDLYYRLNTIILKLPPLRARLEDLPELLDYFLERLDATPHTKALIHGALPTLQTHTWPGNVRELENLVERVVALSAIEDLDVAALIPGVPAAPRVVAAARDVSGDTHELSEELSTTPRSYTAFMEAQERRLLRWALDQADGNVSEAAKLLELPRSTLRSRLEKFTDLRAPVRSR